MIKPSQLNLPSLRWTGLVAAVVGYFLTVAAIIDSQRVAESTFRLITVVSSIGIVAAHWNLCLLVKLSWGQKWIRWITVTA